MLEPPPLPSTRRGAPGGRSDDFDVARGHRAAFAYAGPTMSETTETTPSTEPEKSPKGEDDGGASAEPPPEPSGIAAALLTARRLGPAGPLALVAAIMPALGGFLLLGTLTIVGPWLESHGAAGIAVYITGFVILSGFALLPTYAQAILGGWAFGFAFGFPAALTGFLGGSLIGYVVARRAASRRVMEIVSEKPTWLAVRESLIDSGFWRTLGLVTLIRIPPNSPFALTNLVLGSTQVAVIPYAIGTLVGMAPRTGVAVFIAAGIQDLAQADEAKPKWLIVGGIVLTVIIILIIGKLANNAIAKATGAPQTQDASTDIDAAAG